MLSLLKKPITGIKLISPGALDENGKIGGISLKAACRIKLPFMGCACKPYFRLTSGRIYCTMVKRFRNSVPGQSRACRHWTGLKRSYADADQVK